MIIVTSKYYCIISLIYIRKILYMWWLTEKMVNFILFNNYLIFIYMYIICRISKIESNVYFMLRKQNV